MKRTDRAKSEDYLLSELEQKISIALDFLLKLQEAVHERLCSWRASRNVDVNGHNAIAASNDGI